MAWKKESFGMMPDKTEVDKFILTNKNGVEASFTNLGGSWLTMLVPDKKGKLSDVVLGYDTVEKLLNYPGHLCTIVGRSANRIGGASFTLNGKTYDLTPNNGKHNNLHSGMNFYSHRRWEAEVVEVEDGTCITFSLSSPDGDQGYPGNAEIKVSYTLTEDNSLKLDYTMTADEDTIANFTHHAYFNLGGHESGSILDHEVWIDADAFTPTDEESIPTGEICPVAGTPMDFTTMKPIGRDIESDYEAVRFGNGFDHNWVLNHPEKELALCAKAMDPKSGRIMEVFTDLPGVQLYTGNFLDGNYEGKDGVKYNQREAYCFETQYFPDAINKPNFPSPILKKGETYRTTTMYRFLIS